MNRREEQYKVFKQVIHTFYLSDKEKTKEVLSKVNNVIIEPKLIYDTFHKTLKAEFKIGHTTLYKIKSLPEFFERMLNGDTYQYGSKLNFVHSKEAFADDQQPLLNFVLKYAEIIKYANETVGSYGKYMRTMSNEYITISNTGLDELFDVLEGKKVQFKRNTEDENILFEAKNPDIFFSIEQEENGDYVLTPNIDIFSYDILQGANYLYLLTQNTLYRCDKHFEETTLKMLHIYRENYTAEIRIKREELPNFCSLIYPKLKQEISLKNLDETIIQKYIPQELFIKLYLDYDENNYVIADIKFVYGETEFNPLKEEQVNVARDIAKENEYLDIFVNTGFMLDRQNHRLILASEEKIYHFLSEEIEVYMQKFEVLATDTFKKREIRKPKISSIGVRIENNLLKIDFSQMDFDIEELKEIMQKYRLKKKYHRLKDGSFLDLEENETMDFMDSLLENEEVSYEEIKQGEISLPVARSLYLDQMLQGIQTNVSKNENYKKIVNQVAKREMEDVAQVPQGLKSSLRSYQKIGYQWLKVLDSYHFGGILADDMGLRKNHTITCCITSLSRRNRKSKTKHGSMSKFSNTKLAKRNK